MALNIPAPSEVRSFVGLARDENTEAFLPVYTVNMRRTPTQVVGFMWFRPNTTYGCIFNPDSEEWERVGVIDKSEPAFLEIKDDVFDTSVTVIGDHIEPARDLYYELKQKVRDYYDVQLQQEHLEATGELPEPNDIPTCTHPETYQEPAADEPFTRHVCRSCGWLTGLTVKGDFVHRETLLDPTNIEQRGDSITTWESENLSALVSADDGTVGWVDAALYLLGDDAAQEIVTLTGYESLIFAGSLMCRDDDVVGYTAWNHTFEEQGTVALRHLFVRPEYRGEGLATQLVDFWWNQMPEETFFVGDPNPSGKSRYRGVWLLRRHLRGDASCTRYLRVADYRFLHPVSRAGVGSFNPAFTVVRRMNEHVLTIGAMVRKVSKIYWHEHSETSVGRSGVEPVGDIENKWLPYG
jgi:GNAT superfamily N-acetyltransferase